MADHSFPEEILTEILKRLSVKSVSRFKCVKKSWYNLIQTPYFIDTHLSHQKTCSDNRYLIFHAPLASFFSIRYDDKQCEKYYELKFGCVYYLSCSYGISNGLICLSAIRLDYDSRIYLCNPAIRKLKRLPNSPVHYQVSRAERFRFRELCRVSLAFGYSLKFNDYKVVKIVICRMTDTNMRVSTGRWQEGVVDVYSLSTNSWKTVCVNFQCNEISNSVFVNGNAYWVGKKQNNEQVVVCFDTENETIREILLPHYSSNKFIFKFHQAYGESLLLSFWNWRSAILDMWILVEGDETNGGWKKKISIDLQGNYRLPLGFRNNGEIVLRKSHGVGFVSYDHGKQEKNDFFDSEDLCSHCYESFQFHDECLIVQSWNRCMFVDLFMESLVPLDDHEMGFKLNPTNRELVLELVFK